MITLTKILENKAAKLTLLVSLITSISFLTPIVTDFLIGDTIKDNNEEVYKYIDQEIEKVKIEMYLADEEAQGWLGHFLIEINRIDYRYREDSLEDIRKKEWHQVGLRANKDGALVYRNRYMGQYPVRANWEKQRYEYKDSGGDWTPCFFENQ